MTAADTRLDSPLDSRLADDVWHALDAVRDPELDEPVTTLGFVASHSIDVTGTAEVHLRLPTYFCAPNFAYLMVADAYEAVSAVPGVRRAIVILDDHFASDEINAGTAARAGFVGTFGDEVAGEIDTLRATFVRKAVLAGTRPGVSADDRRRHHLRRAGRHDPRRRTPLGRPRAVAGTAP